MMSFSSSIVCVIGCRWPRRGRTPGTVGSKPPAAAATVFCRGDPLAGLFQGGLDLLLDGVETRAGGRLVGLLDAAEALLHGLQPPALGPQKLNPRGLDGLGVGGRRQRRPPRGPDRPVRRETQSVPCGYSAAPVTSLAAPAASLAAATTWSKAAGSLTAISARILRSRPILALVNAQMNSL